MKRLFSMMLAIIMVLSITACGEGDKNTAQSMEESAATEITEDDVIYITINDNIETDNFLMSFSSFEIVPEFTFVTNEAARISSHPAANEGSQLAVLKGRFFNKMSSALHNNVFNLSFVANDEYEYDSVHLSFAALNVNEIEALADADFYMYVEIPDRLVDIFEEGTFLIKFKEDMSLISTHEYFPLEGESTVTTDEDYIYAVVCGLDDIKNSEESDDDIAMNNKDGKTYKIGEEVIGNLFKVTLTSAEFVYAVDVNNKDEDFMLPMTEGEAKLDPDYAMYANDGFTLIAFTFDYEFLGKEKREYDTSSIARPILYYGDYVFDTNYFVVDNNRGNDDSWYLLNTDLSDSTRKQFAGLGKITGVNGAYQPLENKVHEGRGVMSVSAAVGEDEEIPIELFLSGFDVTFEIR